MIERKTNTQSVKSQHLIPKTLPTPHPNPALLLLLPPPPFSCSIVWHADSVLSIVNCVMCMQWTNYCYAELHQRLANSVWLRNASPLRPLTLFLHWGLPSSSASQDCSPSLSNHWYRCLPLFCPSLSSASRTILPMPPGKSASLLTTHPT